MLTAKSTLNLSLCDGIEVVKMNGDLGWMVATWRIHRTEARAILHRANGDVLVFDAASDAVKYASVERPDVEIDVIN